MGAFDQTYSRVGTFSGIITLLTYKQSVYFAFPSKVAFVHFCANYPN